MISNNTDLNLQLEEQRASLAALSKMIVEDLKEDQLFFSELLFQMRQFCTKAAAQNATHQLKEKCNNCDSMKQYAQDVKVFGDIVHMKMTSLIDMGLVELSQLAPLFRDVCDQPTFIRECEECLASLCQYAIRSKKKLDMMNTDLHDVIHTLSSLDTRESKL